MAVIDNQNTILYLAHQRLAEWGGIIAESSVRKSRKYQIKAEKLRYFLKAMEYSFYLEEDDIISLLQCINNLAELTDWPTAPIIAEQQAPAAITGIQGATGPQGADGADGSDANINTVSGDDIIVVATTYPGGIKTNTITYEPYSAPTISLSIEDAGFANPNSLIQELGVTLASVPITTIVNKGKDTVASSTLLSPGALDAAYQLNFDLANLNLGNQETVVIADTNLSTNQTYQAEVDDSTNQPTSSKTITFVIPFLQGDSATLLTQGTFYANLTRIIEAQGDKAVLFNGVDSYFYFMYDASYPDLDDILDGNGFSAIGAFTLTTENATMTSGVESMKVYKTIITDIPNQTYTFKF